MKQPRFYQRKAHKAVFKAWMEYQSCLVAIGTGGGKSFVAASIIDTVLKNGKRALYLADSNDLCYQPIATISEVAGVIPALEKAEHVATLEAPVVVGSMQTLANRDRLERFPRDHFDYLLIDEAHRGSPAKAKIAEHFPKAFVCGFTATPFRANLRNLSKWYQTVAINLPMRNLVDIGFAPPIEVVPLPVEVDLNEVRMSRGTEGQDYNPNDLDTCIQPYYEAIADLIAEYAWDRKGVCFLPLIKSSEIFAQILRRHGIAAMHIDGKTENRQLVYRKLKEGEIQFICNSQVMSTGVDVPEADCFVNLRATRSAGFYQQGLGRVCRPYPGCIDHLPEENQAEQRKAAIASSRKPNTLILDLQWNHDHLNTITAASIFAGSKEEEEKIKERIKDQRTPAELLMIAKAVQREKELKLVEELKHAADKHRGRLLRAEHVGVFLNDKTLLIYEPIAQWELQKPSPEQLALLDRFGIEPASVQNKGFATKLIGNFILRQRAKLCTPRQARVLRQKGVFEPEKMSFKEASRVLDELIGKKDVDTATKAA